MGRRSLWVSMTFLAGLSGCSGSSDGELYGASDAGSPDTAAPDAAIDAKPDRRPVDAAYDARRDGTAVVDATVDVNADRGVVADAASDAGSDGTADMDGALDANADRGVVADAANDAGSDGMAAMDGTVDAELDGTIAADAADAAGDAAMEAGAQDASAQDGAPSEAGTPTDAAADSPAASTCTLSAVAATPFPQLSGIADVTGTVVTATGAVTMGPGMNCIAGVTTPTSGALLFAFNSTDCYFSYQDASGGTVFTSTIGDTGFDGDTYVCSFTGGWGLTGPDMPSFETACPELLFEPGVNASVSLAVTRSTGAVTVSRQCVNIGVAQFCSQFPDSTGGVQSNELTLSGSLLSCAAPGAGGQNLCGTTSCSVESQVCCLGSIGAPATFCSDTTADCIGAGIGELGAIACSGPESCGPGEVCCSAAGLALSQYPGAVFLSYQCQLATTCPAGSPVVCESNADCPAGETCSTAEPGICGP
jgi:hypothetical protein